MEENVYEKQENIVKDVKQKKESKKNNLERKKMDMKNNVKRMFIMILACMLSFSAASEYGSINVEAAAKVTKIKLSKKKFTLNVGNSKKLKVTLAPTKAKKIKVTWTSSNKKVATVKDGKVTGVSTGTATITAKAGRKKASCKVKVTLSKKAKDAIHEYKKYLNKRKIKWDNKYADSKYAKFMLVDVNADGIPELFIDMLSGGNKFPLSYAEDWQKIYCYNNEKIIEVGGGHNIISYYPLSGIVSVGTVLSAPVADMICYYKISQNGKVSKIAYSCDYAIDSYGDDYWWGKYVTKSEFNNILRKTVGKKKLEIKESDWNANTTKNRKNMTKLIKK